MTSFKKPRKRLSKILSIHHLQCINCLLHLQCTHCLLHYVKEYWYIQISALQSCLQSILPMIEETSASSNIVSRASKGHCLLLAYCMIMRSLKSSPIFLWNWLLHIYQNHIVYLILNTLLKCSHRKQWLSNHFPLLSSCGGRGV